MKIVRSVDVPIEPVKMAGAENVQVRWLISKDDGAPNFAMRMFEIEPGGNTPLHSHPGEHEVFIVEGTGIFVYEGTEHPFAPGYVIFVDPDVEHCFKNTSESVVKFLCIIPQ
jgi:quercetin dioxygenase-like cupin family protein